MVSNSGTTDQSMFKSNKLEEIEYILKQSDQKIDVDSIVEELAEFAIENLEI